MINIILCGGSGTRLWPMSRTLLPKQFVRLFEGRSLFQKTVERNLNLCSSSMIVSNLDQYFLALDQLSDIKSNLNVKFLLEPVGRNTAPAIALACLALDPEEIVLVTSSDHIIKKQSEYEAAVVKAAELAGNGSLVTFGIEPHYAETGYGYIEAENNDVLNFKEKPGKCAAEEYLEANFYLNSHNKPSRYYWNSGMFCFKVSTFLAELERYAPDMFKQCQKAYANITTDQLQLKINMDDMLAIPSDSIDYAVMERSKKVKVVPCDIGWSDLGSFDSLYDELKTPDTDNIQLSFKENDIEVVSVDSHNNLIVTEGRQIALVDVQDLLVVDTPDALLISKKGSSQKVKDVVQKIKSVSKELTEVHRVVHRPWGSYEVLLNCDLYKIKRVVVKPERKLSLQKHLHRNEHWIIVSGTATVTVGEEKCYVRPNESTYINMGQVHRLENEGKIDLVLIEVQMGEYTGEDDIIRLEDVYGR